MHCALSFAIGNVKEVRDIQRRSKQANCDLAFIVIPPHYSRPFSQDLTLDQKYRKQLTFADNLNWVVKRLIPRQSNKQFTTIIPTKANTVGKVRLMGKTPSDATAMYSSTPNNNQRKHTCGSQGLPGSEKGPYEIVMFLETFQKVFFFWRKNMLG